MDGNEIKLEALNELRKELEENGHPDEVKDSILFCTKRGFTRGVSKYTSVTQIDYLGEPWLNIFENRTGCDIEGAQQIVSYTVEPYRKINTSYYERESQIFKKE